MAGRPVEQIPAAEADVHAWAQDYVLQQRRLMQAQRSAGFKPLKPDRAAVTRAVTARFGPQSGRSFGILVWARILFWVVWILMRL